MHADCAMLCSIIVIRSFLSFIGVSVCDSIVECIFRLDQSNARSPALSKNGDEIETT